MDLLLLTSDLASGSRVSAAAQRAGASLRQVHRAAQLTELAAENPTAPVIVELASLDTDVGELTTELRATSPDRRIVAFAPHVHQQRLTAAREAGCDKVLTRGQFFNTLDALLEEWAAPE